MSVWVVELATGEPEFAHVNRSACEHYLGLLSKGNQRKRSIVEYRRKEQT